MHLPGRHATFAFILSSVGFLMSLLFGPAHAESRLESQIDSLVEHLEGKRVGVLTNPTGVDSQFRFVADRLNENESVNLVSFFAPEHGLRGDRQAGGGVDDYTDPITGLPVYSLYGSRSAPTADQLEQLDVFVFDIQDVGSRFYTYVWTMTNAMEAVAAAEKEFVVFDRPNPLGLDKVQGAPITFNGGLVGRVWPGQPFGVATRHGMTAGEIATLVNEEWTATKGNLTVIPVPEYTRSMSFEETGYPWVIPSPNMPTQDTAIVYPGMCIFESSNVSEGRGTTRPFETIGAPFVNGHALAGALNDIGLPGVRFRPAWFKPWFDNFSGQYCGGIQVHVTDRESFDPVLTGMHTLKKVYELYPEDVTISSYASTLMGVPDLHNRLQTESVDAIAAEWEENLNAFKTLRAKHLIYPESNSATGWKIE